MIILDYRVFSFTSLFDLVYRNNKYENDDNVGRRITFVPYNDILGRTCESYGSCSSQVRISALSISGIDLAFHSVGSTDSAAFKAGKNGTDT